MCATFVQGDPASVWSIGQFDRVPIFPRIESIIFKDSLILLWHRHPEWLEQLRVIIKPVELSSAVFDQC